MASAMDLTYLLEMADELLQLLRIQTVDESHHTVAEFVSSSAKNFQVLIHHRVGLHFVQGPQLQIHLFKNC